MHRLVLQLVEGLTDNWYALGRIGVHRLVLQLVEGLTDNWYALEGCGDCCVSVRLSVGWDWLRCVPIFFGVGSVVTPGLAWNVLYADFVRV